MRAKVAKALVLALSSSALGLAIFRRMSGMPSNPKEDLEWVSSLAR